MSELYKLSVTRAGVTVSAESQDKEWVEERVQEYLSSAHLTPLSGAPEDSSGDQGQPSSVPASMTIPEFFRNYIKPLNLKSRPDLALFFVYYLEKMDGREEIKTSDAAACFAAVGYANHNKLNYTDILTSNRKKGLLNYVGSQWSLTFTGEDYVLNKLSSVRSDESK
jgi:hypothetical protein